MSLIMPELLRDILLESTFASNRAVRGGVYSIDKGVFAQVADNLIAMSLSDTQKKERLVRVLVEGNGRILVDQEHTIGSPKEVSIPVKGIKSDLRFPVRFIHPDNKSSYLAMVMHSHGLIDVPPSPNDFYTVLLLTSFSAAASALYVATESQDYLVMRGPHAPQWTDEYIKMKADLWKRNWEERHRQLAQKWHSKKQDIDLQNRIQFGQLKQIARTYDLWVFRSRRGGQILSLEDVWTQAA